jgi:hypothetical protein
MAELKDPIGPEGVRRLAELDEGYEGYEDLETAPAVFIVADMLYNKMCAVGLEEPELELLRSLGYGPEELARAEAWLMRKLGDQLIEARDWLVEAFR